MIAKAGSKDLRLALQPPECSGVDNAIPVALKVAAVSVRGFRKSAASLTLRTKRKSAQHSFENNYLVSWPES
jgi:hypothetical protein